jgi:hypothetical protein
VNPSLCTDCGDPDADQVIDGVLVCAQCADARIADATGFPRLPLAPFPIVVTGFDGREHILKYRISRVPSGISVELAETGLDVLTGYKFAALGTHDQDVDQLLADVRERAMSEIGTVPLLEPDPNRGGSLVAGDEVHGRFVWHEALTETDPYDVVIDGRTLTWREFGQTLKSFEGWRFHLTIQDPSD